MFVAEFNYHMQEPYVYQSVTSPDFRVSHTVR